VTACSSLHSLLQVPAKVSCQLRFWELVLPTRGHPGRLCLAASLTMNDDATMSLMRPRFAHPWLDIDDWRCQVLTLRLNVRSSRARLVRLAAAYEKLERTTSQYAFRGLRDDRRMTACIGLSRPLPTPRFTEPHYSFTRRPFTSRTSVKPNTSPFLHR
jgi:hypothetical protein